VRDDDDLRSVRKQLLGRERSAERHRHIERLPETSDDALHARLQRIAGAIEKHALVPVGAAGLHDILERFDLLELRARHAAARCAAVGHLRADAVEVVGRRKRQLAEQHRVDGGEDGRRRADTQRERERGHQRKTRLTTQRPKRKAEILEHAQR
jgi:hypothetical protein